MATEQDTGEIAPVPSPDSPTDSPEFDIAERRHIELLRELRAIRYRVGVLIVWFVVLPIVAGVIALIVVSAGAATP